MLASLYLHATSCTRQPFLCRSKYPSLGFTILPHFQHIASYLFLITVCEKDFVCKEPLLLYCPQYNRLRRRSSFRLKDRQAPLHSLRASPHC
jgi:hypothetical protein